MTKKYNLIPIEDYYIIVGDPIMTEISEPAKSIVDTFSKPVKWKTLQPTIATLGKRIDSLPLIEIPDEKQIWISKTLATITATYSREVQAQALSNLWDAATKGGYSEENMYKAGEVAGKRAAQAKNYSDHYMREEVEKLLKSLKGKRIPIAVELEVKMCSHPENGYSPFHEDICLIVDENNIIHPVNVFYE